MAQSSTAIRSHQARHPLPLGRQGQARQGRQGQVPGQGRDRAARRSCAARAWRPAGSRSSPARSRGGKINAGDIAVFSPPAGHHAGRRHSAGAVLRHRRRRPRKAGHAEADPGHQGRRRRRHLAARGAGQASAVFRRPVREPGGSRRTGRRAGNPAGQGRHLQGKDRGPEEEGQEGPVLPDRGAGRGRDRHGHPADLRDSAVRGAVQGLRRRPAGLHADGHQPVEVRADQGHLHCRGRWAARATRSSTSTSARARCASGWTA